jgi:hypothetical protein
MALPDEQRNALTGWLTVGGLSYAAAGERLSQSFGVKASCSELCRYYAKVCRQKVDERLASERGALIECTIQFRVLDGSLRFQEIRHKP